MNRKSKTFALSTAVLGLVVLVAAGIAAKDTIREQWYLHRLENGAEEEQIVAAEKLGDMRSIRAIPLLLGLNGFLFGASNAALAKIGTPAVPAVMEQLERGSESTRIDVVFTLSLMGSDAIAAVPALQRALEDVNELVRTNAAEVLKRIQGTQDEKK